jgi:hypothetical protein
VSFESLAGAPESFGGAERIPRESERHAKENDSFAAGGALLYVRGDGRRGTRMFGGVEHGREGAKRPSVQFPRPRVRP